MALTVAQMMDRYTLETYASIDAIAKRCGLSSRAVGTNLTTLVRSGWLIERTKLRGRDYWRKIRQASIPPTGLPEESAVSKPGDSLRKVLAVTPATACSFDSLKQTTDSLQIDARLPADDGTTACKSLHGLPEETADNPGQRSLSRDPVRDLGAASPSPANADSAALGSEAVEWIRDLHAKGFALAKIIDLSRTKFRANPDQVGREVLRLQMSGAESPMRVGHK